MAEEQIDYLIAGGRGAMFETLADAEDDAEAGRKAAADACTSRDALIAVAASGRTPYTIAAAEQARSLGCLVIAVVNNADTPLAATADVEVLIDSGPEVISGSTRMGAGTAQKATLNLLSTLVHTRLGAVHDGFMVNVQAGNQKLVARAARIAAAIAGEPIDRAEAAMKISSGAVKPAVLLLSGAADLATAQNILSVSGGNLRLALSKLPGKV
jgi:N-acetylmuramic acid 6-phosphate etherase